MAQKILHPKSKKVVGFLLTSKELAMTLRLPEEAVESSSEIFKPEKDGLYLIDNEEKLILWRKRAAIMATGTTGRRVAEIEQEGNLDRMVELAKKCPAGADVDMMRAYLAIEVQQRQKGIKMGAEQLARSIGLFTTNSEGEVVPNTKLAAKYIRLLQAIPAPNAPGEMMLEEGTGDWEGQWKNQGYADFI